MWVIKYSIYCAKGSFIFFTLIVAVDMYFGTTYVIFILRCINPPCLEGALSVHACMCMLVHQLQCSDYQHAVNWLFCGFANTVSTVLRGLSYFFTLIVAVDMYFRTTYVIVSTVLRGLSYFKNDLTAFTYVKNYKKNKLS